MPSALRLTWRSSTTPGIGVVTSRRWRVPSTSIGRLSPSIAERWRSSVSLGHARDSLSRQREDRSRGSVGIHSSEWRGTSTSSKGSWRPRVLRGHGGVLHRAGSRTTCHPWLQRWGFESVHRQSSGSDVARADAESLARVTRDPSFLQSELVVPKRVCDAPEVSRVSSLPRPEEEVLTEWKFI